ncbi:MAG TPA: NADH-quinone oxidoreductase subunit J [Chloroflexota bacterium]|nr:NADH-quinone oxidoreductase subunit J [Chloroflexota bacterium]
MTTDYYVALAFYVIGGLMVVGALGVVLLPRVVHAALAMVFVFFLISGIYVLLGADFIAATQIIIYVGAITVLFLFAIMLTNKSYAPDSNRENSQWIAAAGVAVLAFGALAYVFSNANIPLANGAAPEIGDVTLALGQLLMGTFLLPFEIAGVLLLAAMIGAIVIAKET